MSRGVYLTDRHRRTASGAFIVGLLVLYATRSPIGFVLIGLACLAAFLRWTRRRARGWQWKWF